MYVLPGELEGVAVGDNLNDFAVYRDSVCADGLDVCVEDSERGVVFEEVGGLLHTSGVVDGDHVERGVLSSVPTSQEVPPDSSESIDGHFQFGLCNSPVLLPSTNLFTQSW